MLRVRCTTAAPTRPRRHRAARGQGPQRACPRSRRPRRPAPRVDRPQRCDHPQRRGRARRGQRATPAARCRQRQWTTAHLSLRRRCPPRIAARTRPPPCPPRPANLPNLSGDKPRRRHNQNARSGARLPPQQTPHRQRRRAAAGAAEGAVAGAVGEEQRAAGVLRMAKKDGARAGRERSERLGRARQRRRPLRLFLRPNTRPSGRHARRRRRRSRWRTL
ncbi:hypothetical protein T484DRAFT_1926564 [Baffinella frigidus]|nr:hypothetical protein T484DRAFT_1926564 [Cryptophyta sp. CCMP2293]